ncbi:MAG: response regulator [Chloroflexi bacterium]|nr:response regulator [Chloroflexota bacterium]
MKQAMAKKVLVVDDEPGVIEIVRANLEWEGFTVSEASDGLEALEQVRAEAPDLVILDVMLPGLDGWGVLERIEANPETAGLPVIMLTVKDTDADIVRGLEGGAVEYVTKPFDPVGLAQLVRLLLEKPDRRELDARRRRLLELKKRLMKPLSRWF